LSEEPTTVRNAGAAPGITKDECRICQNDTGEMLSVVSKGIETLAKQCRVLGRHELLHAISQYPHVCILVHGSCRRTLAYEWRKSGKGADDATTATPRLTRSVSGGFSFRDMCFLCGEMVAGCSDVRRVLSGGEFDKKFKDVIRERGWDEWALAVQGRMDSVSDLFAADAVYHKTCYNRFIIQLPHTPCKVKRGRPPKKDAVRAFECLCDKLESECENEMYTLNDLYDMMCGMAENSDKSSLYTKEYMKELLQNRYDRHIYFASRPGRDDVVGFSHFCDLLLHNKFFADRNEGEGTEAEKLVQKAAKLIMAEIREMQCNHDFYPTANDINSDGLEFLPPLLVSFLKRIIHSPLKQAALGQGIMQAARPNGCLMPLLFGVGVDLDACGLQQVHMKLARLGFSLSCDEIRWYKQSVMQSCPSDAYKMADNSVIVHFVADNVDHNIRTLDGLNTFHGMGIISATILPVGDFGYRNRVVRRLEKPMLAGDAAQNKCTPVHLFDKCNEKGLSTIKLNSIQSLLRPIVLPAIMDFSSLWHAAGMLNRSGRPRSNWSGYMQYVSQGQHSGVANVDMLSIVDLNPSDENCIYSTLLFVMNQAKKLGVGTPDITFDQQLYIKAVDVAVKAALDVVIRLGGFHLLMSFLGSIGHMMKGSGLEEVFGLIFGPNTVQHVLTGKAYARSVRGHFLVHAALNELLLDYLRNSELNEDCRPSVVCCESAEDLAGSFSQTLQSDLQVLYEEITTNKVCAIERTLLECESLTVVQNLLHQLKLSLKANSCTSRLWLLYMTYVDTVKTFLIAERTSNWLLHLHAVNSMLNLFAATGHMNYAKSARLYVQQMSNLSSTHPQLYEQFLLGNHTIRQSDRYWAGLSLDLVIEQTMMRSIKSQGGLTRGRGMHNTARATWLNTLRECATLRAALSDITRSERSTPDHVEVGASRKLRDFRDLYKVKDYFKVYSPFRFYSIDRLVSLSSGVVASSGDCINCDKADEVGFLIQKNGTIAVTGT